jgi:hypothetical protein
VRYLFVLVLVGCGDNGSSSNGGDPRHDLSVADVDMATTVIVDGGVDIGVIQGTLTVTPLDPTLTMVAGQTPPTLQFSATVSGISVAATWSVDRGELGSFSPSGLYTPLGTMGGKTDIHAVYNGQKVTTRMTLLLQRNDVGDPAFGSPPNTGAGGYGGVGGDGPGGPPSMAQQQTLMNTPPTSDGSVKLLYPYDQTVWPRGLLAPLLQWDPGSHNFEAVQVHVSENGFDYQGTFAANKSPFVNLPIPQKAWDELTYSNGGEAVTITLTFLEGASTFGPYSESWKVAPATLKGTVYYNSYGTYLVTNSDSSDFKGRQYGAGTLGIKPGATSPSLVAGVSSPGNGSGCRVCHTVSGNGQVLLTQKSDAAATDYSNTRSIDLLGDTTMGSGTSLSTANLAFPALSRDGKLLFASAGGMINGLTNSGLFTTSGSEVASTGLPAGLKATTPVFSPDGKHLAFTFWGGTISGKSGDQKSLAMIDFDGATAFSNARVLYTPGKPAVWPSFLPDGKGIVFESEVYTDPKNQVGFTWMNNKGELWWIDVATKTPHRLDNLNGTNLPASALHPAGLDAQLNYEPTVNPIASGGYAWVVFTSRRLYGNVATNDPWQSDPRNYDATTTITTKKLWVAAFDLNATPGSDPSHPAFYLPAQEIHAGNSRGFWTVEPCHMDGTSCISGDECCNGYCEPGDAGLACTSTPPVCSVQFEKCTTDADCCSSIDPLACINGVCTLSNPPIP